MKSNITEKNLNPFGFELILDLHGCDASTFNRKSLKGYFVKICNAIGMEREDLHFWDYEGISEEELPTDAHLLGTSAIQFITTSNIVVHTLDLTGAVYVNIFSCKKYSIDIAKKVTCDWFNAKECRTNFIERI